MLAAYFGLCPFLLLLSSACKGLHVLRVGEDALRTVRATLEYLGRETAWKVPCNVDCDTVVRSLLYPPHGEEE